MSNDIAVLGVGMHPWGKWGNNFVEYGVKAAREAYKEWRLVPAPERGSILKRAGDIMVERKEELAQAMTHNRMTNNGQSLTELDASLTIPAIYIKPNGALESRCYTRVSECD